MTQYEEPAAEPAYAALLSAIRRGELSPNERLVENTLAERHGLSRGAIRTALVRLEQDRIVVREPNRGAHVRHVSEHEAIEILEARSALEGLAARRAAELATESDADQLREIGEKMRECYEAGDLLAMSECNARFHRLILELSDSETILRLTDSLHSHMVRFQYRTILVAGRPTHSLAEHQKIIEAIAASDGEAADNAMRTHLSNVGQTLREHLQTRAAG